MQTHWRPSQNHLPNADSVAADSHLKVSLFQAILRTSEAASYAGIYLYFHTSPHVHPGLVCSW